MPTISINTSKFMRIPKQSNTFPILLYFGIGGLEYDT